MAAHKIVVDYLDQSSASVLTGSNSQFVLYMAAKMMKKAIDRPLKARNFVHKNVHLVLV